MHHYSDITFLFVWILTLTALFLTITAETEECGVVNTDQFRNTEKYTRINEFPWMARVAFNISNEAASFETPFLCQAVLISQRHLLVTAKCINRKDEKYEPYAVLLGDWNTANDYAERDCDFAINKCTTPLLIEIDEIITHPFYNTLRRDRDIAILRLDSAVTFSEFIRPICLPGKSVANKEFGSEEFKSTGWFRELGVKQKMSIFAYNQLDCVRYFSAIDNFNITDAHLCGIAGDVSLHYASGAALMDIKDKRHPHELNNAYLAGLMVYRVRSFYKRDQMVFLRIDRFVDWIEQNMY